MNKRKAWNELSPAYRKRLERAGITPADHANRAQPLTAARGHGSHTPSSIRHRESTLNRMVESGRYERLIDRGERLGYVHPNELRRTLDELGPSRLRDILAWQEERHQAYKENHSSGKGLNLETLQEYIERKRGASAWDEFYEEWWDEASELSTGWPKYH